MGTSSLPRNGKSPPRKPRRATPTPAIARSREETPRWARSSVPLADVERARPKPTAKTVRTTMALRRVALAAAGPMIALGLSAALAWIEGRRLAPAGEAPLWAIVAVLVAWSLRLLTKIIRMVRALPTREPTTDAIDLELALLLPVGAVAVSTHFPDAIDGAGYALVYAALALVATFAGRRSMIVALVFTLVVEAAIRTLAHDGALVRGLLTHALVCASFVALNGLVLRQRIERIRERARRRLEREIERMREQARSWRLVDHAPSTASVRARSARRRSWRTARCAACSASIVCR